jgi:hypothetical protein
VVRNVAGKQRPRVEETRLVEILDTDHDVTVLGWRIDAVDDLADYLRAAGTAATALPVLDGPAWRRFLDSGLRTALSGDTHGDSAHHGDFWSGTVICCDPRLDPVGRVLATRTGRPYRTGDLAEALELSCAEPVTAVAAADTLTPELFALIPQEAQLGLFPVRSVAEASVLAARTIVLGARIGELTDVLFDTQGDEDSAATLAGPEVTPAGLRASLAGGAAVLAGRGHARDCLLHLSGGGICGRGAESPALTDLPPLGGGWSGHVTACQQGMGCWRDDVAMHNHVRAADLDAAVVALDACQTAIAGAGRIRVDTALPMTLLAHNAIAAACAVGARVGAPHLAALFRALLRSGLATGQALAEINGTVRADPSACGKLVLFGDAGLALRPAARPVCLSSKPLAAGDRVSVPAAEGAQLVRHVPGSRLLATEADGPIPAPRSDGTSSWVLTRSAGGRGGAVAAVAQPLPQVREDRIRPWLRALAALPGMGISAPRDDLSRLERAAGNAWERALAAATSTDAERAAADLGTVTRDLAELQRRIVGDEVHWVATTRYAFDDNWPEPWRVTTIGSALSCPQCGGPTVERHRVQPARSDLALLMDSCARCGNVTCGAEEFGAELTVTCPPETAQGTEFTVECVVTAPPDRPVDVAVGVAIGQEAERHCALRAVESVSLPAGESGTLRFPGHTVAGRTKPDMHMVKVLVLADGALRCLSRSLWVRVLGRGQSNSDSQP